MTTLARIEANQRNGQLSTGPRTAEGKAIASRNATRHGIFAAVPVIPGESPEEWEAHRSGVVESLAPVGLLEVNLAERAALLLWRLQRLARYEAQTVAAAMEDLDVPDLRTPDDPLASFGAIRTTRTFTRADQLRDLRKELRAARTELAAVAPARDLCRALEPDPACPVPLEVAATLFQSGYDHVTSFADRRDDPPMFGGKAFRRLFAEPESDPSRAGWTWGAIRRGLAHYATFTGESPERLLAAVGEALDERADELARTVRRLECEAAAVERLLDTGVDRKRSAMLLPEDGREERIARYERHLHNLLTSTLHELERLQARREGEAVPPPAVADVNVTLNSAPE
jgi:hypothetical protein